MTELVVMADVEELLIDYLTSSLAGDGAPPVGTRLENLPGSQGSRPPESVVLFRTGGVSELIVSDRALVVVEVRARTETRAQYLAQLVRAYLHALPGRILSGHQVYAVAEAAGPGNLPDPATSLPRYSATYQIHVAGSVVNVA